VHRTTRIATSTAANGDRIRGSRNDGVIRCRHDTAATTTTGMTTTTTATTTDDEDVD